jgi:chromosome segregation ATPase
MSSEQLKRITVKLQELVKKYDNLKKENERLRGELLPSKEREVSLLEQIGNLEQRIMVLKAGAGKLDDADKKELDKRLHTYLKEIDRCISMLSE